MQWMWIMVGGALGAMARYSITLLQLKMISGVTWPSTLMVNLVGCLGLGVSFALWKGSPASLAHKFFWIIGFWGSFTTFSTFGLDFFQLLEKSQIKTLILYVLASVGLGALFVIVGFEGGKKMFGSKDNPLEKFGIIRKDEHAWLKDKNNAEVIKHLEAENKQTDEHFSKFKPLEDVLYQEMISRINEDDESYPYLYGAYEYFSKINKGENYRKYYRRKKGTVDNVLLLDGNALAKDQSFFQMGSFEISPSGNLLAYTADFNGSEFYTVYIKNLSNNEMLDISIDDCNGHIEWGVDDTSIFYQKLDHTHRPYQIYHHTIGQNHLDDTLIYEDLNLSNFVGMSKSRSERFLFVSSQNKLSSEMHYIDLQQDPKKVVLFAKRKAKVLIDLDHHEDHFIIHTNEDAIDFKVLKTPIGQTDPKHWVEVFPHQKERFIEDVSVFKNFWVLWERYQGNQHLRIFKPLTQESFTIPFEEKAFSISPDFNAQYETTHYRFSYSSMKTPPSILSYDVEQKTAQTLKVYEVPGKFEPNDYVVDKVFAPSRDGKTQIPISILTPKNFKNDGSAKVLLYGYGSYGITVDAGFNVPALSLVDRGFIYAIAHVRGDSTNGRSWYEDGKFLNKKNTFYDFIDCAEFLIEEKYTKEKQIAIMGGSAGGLLMGAAVNEAPNLWGAVLALVPFVDVVNTMLDDTLPLTVTEYDEWGNPHEEKFFRYMLSYAPYENIQDNHFPSILATGGINDPRVGFWEPAKWVMRLREHQKGNNPILLKMEMGAGHQGPSGRYHYYRERASYYGFVISELQKP